MSHLISTYIGGRGNFFSIQAGYRTFYYITFSEHHLKHQVGHNIKVSVTRGYSFTT